MRTVNETVQLNAGTDHLSTCLVDVFPVVLCFSTQLSPPTPPDCLTLLILFSVLFPRCWAVAEIIFCLWDAIAYTVRVISVRFARRFGIHWCWSRSTIFRFGKFHLLYRMNPFVSAFRYISRCASTSVLIIAILGGW